MVNSFQCSKSLANHSGNQDTNRSSLLRFGCTFTSCGFVQNTTSTKPNLRRLYFNINLHLFEIANLTGQRKEDIVLWIEGASNPAEKLGKFDIDKDTVEKWISLANQVLKPSFLQQHPIKYLDKLIHNSKERIKLILQGDTLKMKQIRILQKKLQLDTLVAMKDIHQNIPYKERI